MRCWGIKTLIFAGVVAEVCIETSLRSAFVRDFDVILARECVGSWNEANLSRCMELVECYFGAVLTNRELLDLLSDRW